MADELVNISDQFKGLPMGDLIGGPLNAACEAQVKLAQSTADFIKVIGFEAPTDPANEYSGGTRYATFSFMRPVEDNTPYDPANPPDPSVKKTYKEEKVEICVPLLSIVNVPNLSIKKVDITFDMEVKSSFSSTEKDSKSASLDATMSIGWGCFKAKAHVQGSISSSKENTRSSDNSAKYHVEVHAEDNGMPEGLSRVMDILQTAAVPRSIEPPTDVTPKVA